jgi:lipase maturation factor 1
VNEFIPTYALTRWLFLRLLGVVFLIAFVSYWVQIDGLIGSQGILPAAGLMKSVHELGAGAFWRAPTLCWLGASDAFLHGLVATGTVLSLLLLAGVAQGPVLLSLWAIYLSLVVVGQTFFTFQWDMLLLETALTSLFIVPWTMRPRLPSSEGRVPRGGLWLLRALLFKLMFLSGITKLLCLDVTWWRLTALDFHYYTQPLPVWTSWYAHHLPHGLQRASVAILFAIELGAPFLLFFPRRARIAGALSILALMALIGGTGNYGFFNLLTAVLCVSWLDDAFLMRLLPVRWRKNTPEPPRATGHAVRRIAYGAGVAALAIASSLTFVEEMVRTRPPGRIGGLAGSLLDVGAACVDAGEPVLAAIGPFRSINGYGLFRAMTTARPEIAIEASDDGVAWREVVFRYKAGDVMRHPRFVAPHQPRLDWQMWFAALDARRAGPWLESLLFRILEGSPPVLRLLDDPPLVARPPKFVRLVMYDYRFTTADEAKASGGAWWHRERRGEMTASLTIDSFRH